MYWDAFRHEWIYRKVHEEQEKQKVQFKRHQDQVEAKKKKDAFDAKNEQAQARVEAAQKAKAWRKAKALQDILARQTADKLALAKKAAQAVALAIAQQRKLQEDQGQPPIAVHTTGLLPPPPKKGGPLKGAPSRTAK